MPMSMNHVKIDKLKIFYQKTPYVLDMYVSKMIEEFGSYFQSIRFTPPFASHP